MGDKREEEIMKGRRWEKRRIEEKEKLKRRIKEM